MSMDSDDFIRMKNLGPFLDKNYSSPNKFDIKNIVR
jgi:hypothetical protein